MCTTIEAGPKLLYWKILASPSTDEIDPIGAIQLFGHFRKFPFRIFLFTYNWIIPYYRIQNGQILQLFVTIIYPYGELSFSSRVTVEFRLDNKIMEIYRIYIRHDKNEKQNQPHFQHCFGSVVAAESRKCCLICKIALILLLLPRIFLNFDPCKYHITELKGDPRVETQLITRADNCQL